MSMDPATLRNCLGRFATGVTIVSYDGSDGPRGATVNAFSSVSLDPPLILVSISRRSNTCSSLLDKPFCVNVLAATQVGLALTFAGQPTGTDVEWAGGSRIPRLANSHAWLECDPWRSYDGGDHVLYLGEVRDLAIQDTEPLLFYAGQFHRRGDGMDAAGRCRRPAAQPSQPLDVEALEKLQDEFIAGWL